MEGVNEVLAGIYGTGGAEKVASPGGQGTMTLSDLALLMVVDENTPDDDIEKVAAAADQVHQSLIEYDQAGRAIAHIHFAELEKMAAEGNTEPIAEFFDAEQAPPADSARQARIQAIRDELERRSR